MLSRRFSPSQGRVAWLLRKHPKARYFKFRRGPKWTLYIQPESRIELIEASLIMGRRAAVLKKQADELFDKVWAQGRKSSELL